MRHFVPRTPLLQYKSTRTSSTIMSIADDIHAWGNSTPFRLGKLRSYSGGCSATINQFSGSTAVE